MSKTTALILRRFPSLTQVCQSAICTRGLHWQIKLTEFDNRRYYLALVVWGDSFDVFQLLKNLVVNLGFEYRLMPVAAGEGILDRGGSERRVQ